MVRQKGLSNSHTSTVQEQVANNIDQSKELMAKMDKLLGVIQNYEGKADTTMELMLNMQKTFEEELKTLREENGKIKAQMEGKKNNSEKRKDTQRICRRRREPRERTERKRPKHQRDSSENKIAEEDERKRSFRYSEFLHESQEDRTALRE